MEWRTEHLLCKCEALRSNPSSTKGKKILKRKEKTTSAGEGVKKEEHMHLWDYILVPLLWEDSMEAPQEETAYTIGNSLPAIYLTRDSEPEFIGSSKN
jgi:hypothetical protein